MLPIYIPSPSILTRRVQRHDCEALWPGELSLSKISLWLLRLSRPRGFSQWEQIHRLESRIVLPSSWVLGLMPFGGIMLQAAD